MTDSCLICECEPIEPNGWYSDDCHNHICPWCVEEMFRNREIVERLKERILLCQGNLNLVPIPNVNNELLDKITKYLILELQSILKGETIKYTSTLQVPVETLTKITGW